jgi:hypothetical protein
VDRSACNICCEVYFTDVWITSGSAKKFKIGTIQANFGWFL